MKIVDRQIAYQTDDDDDDEFQSICPLRASALNRSDEQTHYREPHGARRPCVINGVLSYRGRLDLWQFIVPPSAWLFLLSRIHIETLPITTLRGKRVCDDRVSKRLSYFS